MRAKRSLLFTRGDIWTAWHTIYVNIHKEFCVKPVYKNSFVRFAQASSKETELLLFKSSLEQLMSANIGFCSTTQCTGCMQVFTQQRLMSNDRIWLVLKRSLNWNVATVREAS